MDFLEPGQVPVRFRLVPGQVPSSTRLAPGQLPSNFLSALAGILSALGQHPAMIPVLLS